jgi:5'-nucleotidase
MSMSHSRRHRAGSTALALLAAAAIAVLGSATVVGGSPTGIAARSVSLQLLSINDFHGNLEPPTGSSGRITTAAGPVNAGGVTYLATHLKQLRAGHPNSITVSAGDNIGASPLISGFFHDEPAIEALSALGLQIASVGNHEFDEGAAELLRMQNGGCHPVDGCQDGDGFAGADFQYLSANVVVDATGKTLFPAYQIRNVDGVRVAFIGLTLEGTPTIVTPAGTAGLTFRDEADTVNALVDNLARKARVESFVVLIHEGGFQSLPPGYVNNCDGISGAIVDIVSRLSSRVDVVLSGHTHQAYNCELPNSAGHDMLVTSASSFGRVATDVEIKMDRATGDVSQASADNVIVTRDVPTDPAEDAIIAKYNGLIADVKNQVIGSITGDITRTANAAGEQPLGDVIADAQLEATDNEFGAQLALMNPGGIRTDLVCDTGEVSPCPVIFNEVFSVQPFSNDLVTMDLTGAQLKSVLEQQFNNPSVGEQRFLQVSKGFSYSWSASAAIGSKVSNITLNGTPVDPNATYRVTVNSFLSGGGDNFTTLASGTNRVIGPVDLAALVTYVGAHSPVAPGPQDRYTTTP